MRSDLNICAASVCSCLGLPTTQKDRAGNRFHAGATATGLDRWAKCPHRLSLWRRQGRHDAKICSRACCARAGRHPSLFSAALAPLLEATRAIPIVFAGVADPVAAGYVESLARPGGNATGFTVYEYSIGGKWLELLKQVAPQVTRVAVLRESGIAAGPGLFGAIQALAPSFGLELRPIDVRDAAEIEQGLQHSRRVPTAA